MAKLPGRRRRGPRELGHSLGATRRTCARATPRRGQDAGRSAGWGGVWVPLGNTCGARRGDAHTHTHADLLGYAQTCKHTRPRSRMYTGSSQSQVQVKCTLGHRDPGFSGRTPASFPPSLPPSSSCSSPLKAPPSVECNFVKPLLNPQQTSIHELPFNYGTKGACAALRPAARAEATNTSRASER